MADVRVGRRAGERVEINEKKGKVHVSAAEGRLSEEEEEVNESLEGRKGLGRFMDDLIVERRCFRW